MRFEISDWELWHKVRLACVAIGLCLTVIWLQGCIGSSGGRITGGAIGGRIVIRGNEVRVTRVVGLERAWEAVKGVASELGWVVRMELTQKSNSRAVMAATDREGRIVVVQLDSRSSKATEIRVRVGDTASSANSTQAELVYRRLAARL